MNDVNERYERILLLIRSGKTFTQIAEALGIWKSQLSTTLKIMERRGLIERRHQGRLLILTVSRTIANASPIPAYRIHNLWLTLRLKDGIGNDTTALLRSKGISVQSTANLRNHTDSFFIQDGYEGRLTPSSLEVHLPDLDGLPLEADLQGAVLDAFHKLETIVLRLEDRLGLKVVRIDKDTIMAKISQLHIALKNHQFAETVNERGEKLYVYVEGELRVLVDASHGLHEYEAVNATHAIPDGQRLGKLSKAVIEGRFDYEQDHELLHQLVSLAQRSEERQSKTEAQVLQIVEQLNIHAPYLSAWKVVADAINEPIKRQRARKAIERLGQSRLFGDEG